MSKDLWNNDNIQFCRLIAELDNIWAFDVLTIQKLSKSMDLDQKDIYDIINRAIEKFDKIKAKL